HQLDNEIFHHLNLLLFQISLCPRSFLGTSILINLISKEVY
ncbi:hypothetical protein DB41_AR00030, partial [Neochlamydia sp. TUME1]